VARFEGLPRPAALALRNVARRRVRLVLTLVALSLAGAMFIANFGLRLGLYEAIEILVAEFPYDVVIDFAGPERVERIEREIAALDAEARFETWGVADARRVYPDGRVGSSFVLFGVPPETQIAAFANRDGRWLGPGDTDAIYINYEVEKLTNRPTIGEALALRVNGVRERVARLVGISLRPFDANAYVPLAAFEEITGARGQAGRLVVYLGGAGPARQAEVADALVARYEAAGMPVLRAETAGSFRANYRTQFNTLIILLMALAGLTALVGGLGLANTMALNVLERSREIGVLRAMGAERGLLRRLVLAEGLMIALVSAVFAVLLAVPLTLILDRVMGGTLLGSPLSFVFSPAAAVLWLALVVVIGLVACWLPAERAARMTIRQALAYE
jgi:putative ABC transport system permease protein